MKLDPYSYFGEIVRVEERGDMLLTETAYEAGMRLPIHSHGSSHLAILLEGGYIEKAGDRTALYLPGDAVFYPRDVHHADLLGNRVGRCLNLEFPEDRLPAASTMSSSYVPTEIGALIAADGAKVAIQSKPWLVTARRLLDSGSASSLRSLAFSLAVHPGYLARSFRSAFGLSVGQYSMLSRLRRAGRRLIESETPIGEIALDFGFFDQSHFSNAFAGIAGFTPAAVRHIAHS